MATHDEHNETVLAIARGLEMLRLAGSHLPRLVDELERVVDMRKVEALRRALPDGLHPDHRYDYKGAAKFLGMKPSSVKSIPAVDLPRAAPGRIEGIDLMAYRGDITYEMARQYKHARCEAVQRTLRLVEK